MISRIQQEPKEPEVSRAESLLALRFRLFERLANLGE
jgi:hypothetical protein